MRSVQARPPVSEKDGDVYEAPTRFDEDCQTIAVVPPLGGAETGTAVLDMEGAGEVELVRGGKAMPTTWREVEVEDERPAMVGVT